jgi:hypothetical protein
VTPEVKLTSPDGFYDSLQQSKIRMGVFTMKGTPMLANIDKFLMGKKVGTADPLPMVIESKEFLALPEFNPKHQHSLLAMAKLFAKLRSSSGVWQLFVYELLELKGVDIKIIAKEVSVSARTIKRILASDTQQPSVKTSFKLFFLHSRLCTERYRINERGEVELDMQ